MEKHSSRHEQSDSKDEFVHDRAGDTFDEGRSSTFQASERLGSSPQPGAGGGKDSESRDLTTEATLRSDPEAPNAERAFQPVPDYCGPYRILKHLGEGGMGEVYLGERRDELKLRVAIKILSQCPPRLQKLFKQECEILSGLQHEGIAHLIDAGTLPNGQPWMAMEYVEGCTLSEYVCVHNPSLRERLNIFIKVCDALSYAHGQMIIHRDLKPSNIMVTNKGIPKLLDFGIAAFLDPSTGEQVTVTRRAERMMTPEYASPEQINGLRLSAVSDVYSMGVVLYELLSGQRPYEFKSHRPLDIVHVVNESVILKPSSRESNATVLASDFVSRLRGDLDTIVLKALVKEPGLRYASVEALAGDLRAYLHGMPILARPLTRVYRLRKWVQRNPLLISLISSVLIFLLAFSGYANWQNGVVRHQRDMAQAQQKTAETVTGFLVQLFEQTDPDMAKGGEVTAFEVMELGRRQVGIALKDQPAVRGQLLYTMGKVYSALGKYDLAKDLFLESTKADDTLKVRNLLALVSTLQAASQYQPAQYHLDQLQGLLGTEQDQSLVTDYKLAQGLQYMHLGMFVKANEVLDQIKDLSGVDINQRIKIHQFQGQLLSIFDKNEQTIEMFQEVLKACRETYGDTSTMVIDTLFEIGNIYLRMKDFKQANSYLQEAADVVAKIYDAQHPRQVYVKNMLAKLAIEKGELAEADALLKQARDQIENTVGLHHQIYGDCLMLLGSLESTRGNWLQALTAYKDAGNVYSELLGENHIQYALAVQSQGGCYYWQSDFSNAEILYRKALAIVAKSVGEYHPVYYTLLNDIGLVVIDKADFDSAEKLFLKSLELSDLSRGESSMESATALQNLAMVYMKTGRLDLAVKSLEKALSIFVGTYGETSMNSYVVRNNLAVSYVRTGRFDLAESESKKCLEIVAENFGVDHKFYGRQLVSYAGLLMKREQYDKAEPLFRQALDVHLKTSGENSSVYITALRSYARCLREKGDLKASDTIFRRVIDLYLKNNHGNKTDFGLCLIGYAELLDQMDQIPQAEQNAAKAISILKSNFKDDTFEMMATYSIFGSILAKKGEFKRGEKMLMNAYEFLRNTNDIEQQIVLRKTIGRLVAAYGRVGNHERAAFFRQKREHLRNKTASPPVNAD